MPWRCPLLPATPTSVGLCRHNSQWNESFRLSHGFLNPVQFWNHDESRINSGTFSKSSLLSLILTVKKTCPCTWPPKRRLSAKSSSDVSDTSRKPDCEQKLHKRLGSNLIESQLHPNSQLTTTNNTQTYPLCWDLWILASPGHLNRV